MNALKKTPFDSEWFKDRLHRERKSQRELADALGIDKATAHNIIHGKRPLRLDEVSSFARFLNSSPIEILTHAGLDVEGMLPRAPAANENEERIPEVNVRELDLIAGHSAGLIEQDGNMPTNVTAQWGMPTKYVSSYLDVSAKDSRLIVMQGDSMEPTLRSGDRIMISTTDKRPSPPGVFAIWDGVGVAVKRLSVRITDPTKMDIISDNPIVPAIIAEIEGINILGRVVWAARKM